MKKTKIEWCDATWNPVTGCYYRCEYCYARRIAERFGGHIPNENPCTIIAKEVSLFSGLTFEVNSMQAKRQKDGKIVPAIYPFRFEPTFHRYRLDDPAQWKEPRNVFVCSMADLFGDWVPDSWINEVFDACERAPQHRYLFLTKNPNRYVDLDDRRILPWADNFWFGTTVTRPADEFTWFEGKKYHWFLSIEPMLERFGPISEMEHLPEWIIIGAETGNRKNKVIPEKEWIDEMVEFCDRYNIPVFMKDSLVPVIGEENMLREFPFVKEEDAR